MKKIITLVLVAILTIGTIGVPVQAKTTSKVVNVSAMKKMRGTCATYGKEVYYIKTTDKKDCGITTLYKCTLEGNNSVKIRSFYGYYTLGAVYNNKIYVSKGSETDGYNTYTISKLGKGKISLVKRELKVYAGKGKYMIGTSRESSDISPSELCTYNAKTKKKQILGQGYSPVIIGSKMYYAIWDKKQKRFVVAYNIVGSKKKHVVAKFPKTSNVYVESLNRKQATYYIDSDGTVTKYTLKY